MDIYNQLVDFVSQGGVYNINLKTKTLKIGRKHYIKNGEVLVDDDLITEISDAPWDFVCELYNNFKHSIPTSHYKDNGYFKALDYEDLSPVDMVYGDDRSVAQAKLEGFILLASLNGSLKWKLSDKWFWQNETDKDFIVLKEWL